MTHLRQAIALLFAISLVSCSSPTPTASPSTPTDPNSEVGKVDSYGVTIKVDTPQNEKCRSKTFNLKQSVFEECLLDGMSRVQVANVIGLGEGTLASQAGNVQIVQWSGSAADSGYWVITARFEDGYLVSKSASNLPPDPVK